MLSHIWVRGKLNYFNMTVKSKMAAIDRFEGLYSLIMRTCIKLWSLNDAYYAAEVKIKDESMWKYNFSNNIQPFI